MSEGNVHQDRLWADVLHNYPHISLLCTYKTPQPISLLSFVLFSNSLTYFNKQGLSLFPPCIPQAMCAAVTACQGEVRQGAVWEGAQGAAARAHSPVQALHAASSLPGFTGAGTGTLLCAHLTLRLGHQPRLAASHRHRHLLTLPCLPIIRQGAGLAAMEKLLRSDPVKIP